MKHIKQVIMINIKIKSLFIYDATNPICNMQSPLQQTPSHPTPAHAYSNASLNK